MGEISGQLPEANWENILGKAVEGIESVEEKSRLATIIKKVQDQKIAEISGKTDYEVAKILAQKIKLLDKKGGTVKKVSHAFTK